MDDNNLKIGFTHGDINGIGYELILKAFADARLMELCTPVVYGSSKIAAYHRKALEIPALNMSNISQAEDAASNRVNMINCISDEIKVELSKPSYIAAEAAVRSLEAAVDDLKRGATHALVTSPVSSRITGDGLYPKHTEYLGQRLKAGTKPMTILVSDAMKVALLSESIPLSDVFLHVSLTNVLDRLLLFEKSLQQDFRIVKPRIAVLSFNPKSGRGVKDSEEQAVLMPAIEEATKRNLLCFGPYSADTLFGSNMYEKFDGIMAMYYEQGMTAFKTIGLDRGIAYTAGLSAVHTTPAHGAAYDIAGRNLASIDSFLKAIYTAIDIYRNRISFIEATANPLRKQYFDKGAGDESVDLTKDDDDGILINTNA
ncbi:MAG: 4-hydroxythreonine-4-phosphate dehydrogenase PdxA [Tannerellaceae bacterium]|jgi:4-hydroxythreonine-4-phosphate dehydrogenase|nr:4-hydroxythreonine-4-phosphate dehydrogenase PdxA [Tannerellaceae bacterium]